MAIAISNTIESLRFRFVNGPAGQFFKWWGGQLSFLLPQKFLDALARGKSLIVVEVNTTSAKLSYINHQQETLFLGEFEFNDLAINGGGEILRSGTSIINKPNKAH